MSWDDKFYKAHSMYDLFMTKARNGEDKCELFGFYCDIKNTLDKKEWELFREIVHLQHYLLKSQVENIEESYETTIQSEKVVTQSKLT